MTPQTEAHRRALIEQAITDTALDYRFDDNSQPILTEHLKAAAEESITAWNRYAEQIDKWAESPKFANGYIGLRLGYAGAMACQFRLTEEAAREGARLPAACWRAIGILDDLADHLAAGATKLTVPVDCVQWMADLIFVSMIPQKLIERAAHSKGHIWDRRLRHGKRAKARRHQAFADETRLAHEDERQEAEFRSLLRDVLRRDRKIRRDVRMNCNTADFDFSTAPPQVRVVRLADRKGFMLMPPRPDRAKGPPRESAREPQKSLLGVVAGLSDLSPADAALELNQRGVPGPVDGRWTAEAIAHTRNAARPKRQSDRTAEL